MSLAIVTLVVPPATRSAAVGTTLYVSTTGHDSGDCQSSPCASVGYALGQGAAGDTIAVGPGVFQEETLLMSYPVTIEGAGASATTLDVSRENPLCAAYATALVTAISITPDDEPCTYAGPAAGVYTFDGLTIEGNPGDLASSSVEPFLVLALALPPDVSLRFTHDGFVTDTQIDPALSVDASIGVYDLVSGATDSIEVSDDTFRGFYQGTFMEAFPGSLSVTDSTFEELTPLTPGPWSALGVFLLADDNPSFPMTGRYSISGNVFENYAGYGVAMKAGYDPTTQGELDNVSIVGNRFDLASLPGAVGAGSAAIGMTGADSGHNTFRSISIRSNSITDVGRGAIDVQLVGDAVGNTFSGVSVTGDDLLGGPATAGIDDGVAAVVAGEGNYWGARGGPGTRGASRAVASNGGSVATSPDADHSVFTPATATAIYRPNGPTIDAVVMWPRPASASNVPVLGYTITPYDGTTGATEAPASVRGSINSATFTGLVAHDRYTFLVVAHNDLVPVGATASNPVYGPGGSGYRLVGANGGVFAFGSARFLGPARSIHLGSPIAAMTTTPTGSGYWLVGRAGGVFAFGTAKYYGSMSAASAGQIVVGIAATVTGRGYWLVTRDGRVSAFGDARSYGQALGTTLGKPIVGIATTPTGNGYWLVASDGDVLAFGDARSYGRVSSAAGQVVGMAPTADGRGYWLATSDGGVFAFGDATFLGSMGARRLNKPIVGITSSTSGSGYLLDAADGGVFAFGESRFDGSMGAIRLGAAVVGIGGY